MPKSLELQEKDAKLATMAWTLLIGPAASPKEDVDLLLLSIALRLPARSRGLLA
jgi:hypothetical protein